MASSSAALPPRYFLTGKKQKASVKRHHERKDSMLPDGRPRKRSRRDDYNSFKPNLDSTPVIVRKSETLPSSPDTVIPINETTKQTQRQVTGDNVRISKILPTVCLPAKKRKLRNVHERRLDSLTIKQHLQTKIGICDKSQGRCKVNWCCTFHISKYGSIPLNDLNLFTYSD